ncbi:ATP10 protein-domain-containing protein [Leucosporidium creatinivorum]|uniref:ATP10 protein-domain-containing protein n=1 Tax=Leucosporidium creatinivorum TaxID=106004 RepID=A0A1Y2G7A0_9BASI|nr:ATP10 protein-domain-containing protein [Leucosporidium creatinivorum]
MLARSLRPLIATAAALRPSNSLPSLALPLPLPLPLPLQQLPRFLSTSPPRLAPNNHLTPEEAAAKKLEEKDTKPPPYLSKALGVKDKPTKGKPSREEWRANLLSRQRRLDERKHLVKQVSKGYFHDYNELRHQGGKAWIAPNTLIREDLSLYFPDIEGVALSNKEKTHTTDLFPGKVSLVVLSSFKSSEEHINSFVRPALADLQDDPAFQYVYINLQENPLKSFLVTMFLSSLRKTIPVSQQPSYLLSHQSLEYLREPMGMMNKHVGYVFLVDWEARIRWAGCSWATADEEEALRRCSHVLVERLKKGVSGP